MGVLVAIGLDVQNFIRGSHYNRIGCTKFCEGCTKGSNMHSDVGISPQALPYRFPNEIMDPR